MTTPLGVLFDRFQSRTLTRSETNELVSTVDKAARRAAHSIGIPTNPVLSMDDAVQECHFRFFKMLHDYDKTRQPPRAFLLNQMHFAVYDYRRNTDNVSRYTRQIIASVMQARNELQQILGREPNSVEIGDHVGMDPESVDKAFISHLGRFPDSIFDTEDTKDGQMPILETLVAECPDPSESKDSWSLLRYLPDLEAVVLYMFYYESKDLKQIGLLFGKSEHRIAQIKNNGITILKALQWKSKTHSTPELSLAS